MIIRAFLWSSGKLFVSANYVLLQIQLPIRQLSLITLNAALPNLVLPIGVLVFHDHWPWLKRWR